MTKQDIIDAIKYYGGKATQSQITAYLKSKNHSGYCSAGLQRLKAWHEVKLEHRPRPGGGQRERVWVLNEGGY
jgi:7-cyano-7-deazaguanine synthase in queuosine biosynthesis